MRHGLSKCLATSSLAAGQPPHGQSLPAARTTDCFTASSPHHCLLHCCHVLGHTVRRHLQAGRQPMIQDVRQQRRSLLALLQVPICSALAPWSAAATGGGEHGRGRQAGRQAGLSPSAQSPLSCAAHHGRHHGGLGLLRHGLPVGHALQLRNQEPVLLPHHPAALQRQLQLLLGVHPGVGGEGPVGGEPARE
jgi:hypothetical protein